MTAKCSICLCAFKEPVSIPCGEQTNKSDFMPEFTPPGHVYCTKCLADHVNTPGSDDTTSSCPTCRTVFNIGGLFVKQIPFFADSRIRSYPRCMSLVRAFYHLFSSHLSWKLTYLPKKYHQYVIPGVRRVYLDASAEAILQKKLTKAEARIRKLEAEQETLLKQCEQHMSAARAHAEGEKKERRRADKLEQDFDTATSQSFKDGEASRIYIENINVDHDRLKYKYQKLKQHCRGLEEEYVQDFLPFMPRSDRTERCRRCSNIIPLDPFEYETPANSGTSFDDSVHNATRSRRILPLPRKRAGPLSSSAQPAIRKESTKRPRLSAPG
jgi:hypothetical protein